MLHYDDAVVATPDAPVNLVACTYALHAESILAIFNDAIAHSTALYDYHPRPLSSMATWFEVKRAAGFPVIGAIDADGTLLGFASYGVFRERPAYKYSVEHSVYVHREHRGKRVGEALMQAVIDAAMQNGVHVLVGGIDMQNAPSIALHEKFGFAHVGTIREAGFKFGRWLDLGFWQRTLSTPANPVDG